jgi:hypothetical protein
MRDSKIPQSRRTARREVLAIPAVLVRAATSRKLMPLT